VSISWRAGAVASSSANGTSLGVTVPSAVQSGDLIMFAVNSGRTSSYSTITGVASTATTPGRLGTLLQVETGGIYLVAAVYCFIAGSSDASAVITVTGSSSTSWGISLGAWSGTAGGQPDVSATATSTGSTSITAPTVRTGRVGDWAVNMVATTTGGTWTSQPGTVREADAANRTCLSDSNGPAGAAGTLIGGGTWSMNVGINETWAAWTVGIASVAGNRTGALLAGFPE
jgi:hypothetical protein